MRALIKRGGAVDVTQRMQRDGVKKDDYVEAWFDEFLYRGKSRYPPDMPGSTASFFYNKDLIEHTGGKVPAEGWTLEDWVDIAQRATRNTGFGTDRPGLWWPFLGVNGADLIDEEKNVCVLDYPAAINSLQFLQDLVHKTRSPATPCRTPPGGADLFIQGRLATMHGWFTDIPATARRSRISPGTRWSWPRASSASRWASTRATARCCSRGNPDGGWEFMKFLGGYDGMLIYGVEGRFVPALKKANPAPQFLERQGPGEPGQLHRQPGQDPAPDAGVERLQPGHLDAQPEPDLEQRGPGQGSGA